MRGKGFNIFRVPNIDSFLNDQIKYVDIENINFVYDKKAKQLMWMKNLQMIKLWLGILLMFRGYMKTNLRIVAKRSHCT